MILSATSPTIQVTPDKVFAFFAAMEKNYHSLHPDHVEFRWVDPPALRPGVRFYFAERIAGKLLKKTVAFTKIEPDTLIEFAPTNGFFRFFLPRITFRISTQGSGLTITQEIQLRIGPLAARLNKRELDAVRVHMREEGENFKKILETRS